jgi:hypothetical protein
MLLFLQLIFSIKVLCVYVNQFQETAWFVFCILGNKIDIHVVLADNSMGRHIWKFNTKQPKAYRKPLAP